MKAKTGLPSYIENLDEIMNSNRDKCFGTNKEDRSAGTVKQNKHRYCNGSWHILMDFVMYMLVFIFGAAGNERGHRRKDKQGC